MDLTNDPVVTDAFKIRFTLNEGPSNGGMPVLDYDVYYDQAAGNYVLLEEAVPTAYYTTSVALTPDLIYSFKVVARNSVGKSLMSAAVSIRAAKVPDAPINLVNVPSVTTAYQIGLDWDEGPYNGGSPVLDYRVSYKSTVATEYVIFASGLTTTEHTVDGLTPSVYYDFKVEARNIVGYSDYSVVMTELAAQIPDAPTSLINLPEITLAN